MTTVEPVGGAGSLVPQPATTIPNEFLVAARELARRLPALLRRATHDEKDVGAARDLVIQVAGIHQQACRTHERATADTEAVRALRSAHPPAVGPRHDWGRRVLSMPVYLAVLLVIGMLAYTIDKGALLVLLLPALQTSVMAALSVVLLLLATHWGGHVLRRRHQAVEAQTVLGRGELRLGTACVVGAYGLAFLVAAVRAADSGLLTGSLFLVLGALDVTVALVASYFVSHDAVSAETTARHRETYHRWLSLWSRRRLGRALGRWHKASLRYRATATTVVVQLDQIRAAGTDTYRLAHPGERPPMWPEPAWLLELRDVSAGTLPDSLDPRESLAAAGIRCDEVI
jgi:hypothetical protein